MASEEDTNNEAKGKIKIARNIKVKQHIEKASQRVADAVDKSTNWLTNSSLFEKFCVKSFKKMDRDNTGSVKRHDVYTGLLLIHLQIATFVGAAACKPVSRKVVYKIFDEIDNDKTGNLDIKEFTQLMVLLLSGVLTRIFVQYSLTILMVPLIARLIIRHYVSDELIDSAFGAMNTDLPSFMKKIALFMSHLPQIFISLILSIVVVPIFLNNLDSFVVGVAEKTTDFTDSKKDE
eukprot:CAMPEP_0194369950 /NCGR_PEP_ID=MMETSP0174-20130528/18338_1 /TAXON_ID=216777 /ORGANISM="Proboscia alata, Strain PI-D3" /LENGTH=233 /DNA_ID=CAMNT_0039147217 /DNA_START=51 /DNA_END=752 /DNA_ORIENTATION=+